MTMKLVNCNLIFRQFEMHRSRVQLFEPLRSLHLLWHLPIYGKLGLHSITFVPFLWCSKCIWSRGQTEATVYTMTLSTFFTINWFSLSFDIRMFGTDFAIFYNFVIIIKYCMVIFIIIVAAVLPQFWNC